jgi:uncharacterized protein (TIGR00251 family)
MRIAVIAHPNSKKPSIEKDILETFHVYVNEPPLKGKANRAIIKSLAKYFQTKTTSVIFISGEKQKNKVFEILKST